MFRVLLFLTIGLAGILALSTVSSLLPGSGPGLTRGELAGALALVGLAGGVAWWAWHLRENGQDTASLVVLVAFWSLAVVGVFVAAGTARWN